MDQLISPYYSRSPSRLSNLPDSCTSPKKAPLLFQKAKQREALQRGFSTASKARLPKLDEILQLSNLEIEAAKKATVATPLAEDTVSEPAEAYSMPEPVQAQTPSAASRRAERKPASEERVFMAPVEAPAYYYAVSPTKRRQNLLVKGRTLTPYLEMTSEAKLREATSGVRHREASQEKASMNPGAKSCQQLQVTLKSVGGQSLPVLPQIPCGPARAALTGRPDEQQKRPPIMKKPSKEYKITQLPKLATDRSLSRNTMSNSTRLVSSNLQASTKSVAPLKMRSQRLPKPAPFSMKQLLISLLKKDSKKGSKASSPRSSGIFST